LVTTYRKEGINPLIKRKKRKNKKIKSFTKFKQKDNIKRLTNSSSKTLEVREKIY
jgi:hypothetical protein